MLAKEPLKTHLVVLELTKASQKSLEAVFAKTLSIETLIFCDNHEDAEVLHFAAAKKISGVMGGTPDAKELSEKLKELLISISSKQKEKSKHDNYVKLVENANVLFCIKKSGKIVFANRELLRLFGVETLSQINEIDGHENELLEFLVGVAEDEEAILAAAEELFAQSRQFESQKEITPFVNISVLSLTHQSATGKWRCITSKILRTRIIRLSCSTSTKGLVS